MSFEAETQITLKYELVQKVGKGAYGYVWKAIDRRTKEIVAVKKIFDAFQNSTDAQRTFREVMFLQRFRHDNIIKLLGVHRAENNLDLYLIFDFLETDLHSVIRANILENVHKQFVSYQLIKTMLYLHSGSLLHRDLKPSNILLDAACAIKVADFGLARSILSDKVDSENPSFTDYVATRWYRAPEILMGSTVYTYGVDMWSIGCIAGEMILGKPLFPGTSTPNQLERIVAMLGKPTAEDVESFKTPYAEGLLSNLSNYQSKSFEETFEGVEPNAANFIRNLLHFDPEKRMSARQALRHPYIKPFRNREEEKMCSEPILIPLSDNTKYTVSEYRDFLYSDIRRRDSSQKSARPLCQPKSRISELNSLKSERQKADSRTNGPRPTMASNTQNRNSKSQTSGQKVAKDQPSTTYAKLEDRMSKLSVADCRNSKDKEHSKANVTMPTKTGFRPRFL